MWLKHLWLLCLAVPVDALCSGVHESARGLDVRVETLEGETGVSGLPVGITRVTGPDVTELAQRIIDGWRARSGRAAVRIESCCGWQIASHIQAGQSTVIQWRPDQGGELLWSEMDLLNGNAVAPRAAAPIPAGCRLLAPVSGAVAGRRFIQASAQCEYHAETAIAHMARLLSLGGWRWQRRDALMLQARRGGLQLQVVAGADPHSSAASRAKSFLVLVESRPVSAAAP